MVYNDKHDDLVPTSPQLPTWVTWAMTCLSDLSADGKIKIHAKAGAGKVQEISMYFIINVL